MRCAVARQHDRRRPIRRGRDVLGDAAPVGEHLVGEDDAQRDRDHGGEHRGREQQARERGSRRVRLETNRSLTEAITMYRGAGYVEVDAFNAEPYAHHWFEKRLSPGRR